MLSNIHIDSFRGLKNVTIDGLGQFNIITGSAGTGKTSILEAISVLCNPYFIWENNQYTSSYKIFPITTEKPREIGISSYPDTYRRIYCANSKVGNIALFNKPDIALFNEPEGLPVIYGFGDRIPTIPFCATWERTKTGGLNGFPSIQRSQFLNPHINSQSDLTSFTIARILISRILGKV